MDEFDQVLNLEEMAKQEAITQARAHFDLTKGISRGLEDGQLLGNELYYYKGFCENNLSVLLSEGAKTMLAKKEIRENKSKCAEPRRASRDRGILR